MQAEGMSHIRNLKQDAVSIWECYGYEPEYFGECVLMAMSNHRLFLREKKKKEEQEASRKELESLWNGEFVD